MLKDPGKYREYRRAYYLAHREEKRAYSRVQYKAHRAALLRRKRIRGQQIRLEVIAHYSNGTMQCAHCETADIDVLCLDHINNDGYEHRKGIGAGDCYNRWVKRNSFPAGYQVLCRNCNWKKHIQNMMDEDKSDDDVPFETNQLVARKNS